MSNAQPQPQPQPQPHDIKAGENTLYTETFGDPEAPAVLLIMGNSAPALVWPDVYCQALAAAGYWIVRFDQRDTGLSSYIDFATYPYTLEDLATDALHVLDGLGIKQAHLIGLSQGGPLAYRIAAKTPHRVLSVTAMMSSIDLRPKNDAFQGLPTRPGELPRPTTDYVAAVIALNAIAPATEEEAAKRFVDNFRLAKGNTSPFNESHWLAMGRAVAAIPRLRQDKNSAAIANHSNHTKAQIATSQLTPAQLRDMKMPVLVIHGENDPIFPLPHAQASAAAIPGASLVVVKDMGHAFDTAFVGQLSAEWAVFAKTACKFQSFTV